MTARLVPTMSIFPLLQCAQAEGLAQATLLAGTRLSAAQLQDAGAMVPFREELAVVRNYLAHTRAPQPALAASTYYHYNCFGVLGAALVSQPDLLTACRFLVRYVDLTFTPFVVTLQERGPRLEARYSDGEELGECRGFYLLRDLAFLRNLCREAEPEHWPTLIAGMDIAMAPPADTAALRAFFRWPLRFGAEATVIHADTARLRRPLRLANAMTAALLERQCEELRTQRTPASWRARVERLLLAEPAAEPAWVAARLCLSERSLRRHLQQEGCTFQAVATALRQRRAQHYLMHSRLSVAAIAHCLGYSETAAFAHAFKRWTGQTPSQFRRHGPG